MNLTSTGEHELGICLLDQKRIVFEVLSLSKNVISIILKKKHHGVIFWHWWPENHENTLGKTLRAKNQLKSTTNSDVFILDRTSCRVKMFSIFIVIFALLKYSTNYQLMMNKDPLRIWLLEIWIWNLED